MQKLSFKNGFVKAAVKEGMLKGFLISFAMSVLCVTMAGFGHVLTLAFFMFNCIFLGAVVGLFRDFEIQVFNAPLKLEMARREAELLERNQEEFEQACVALEIILKQFNACVVQAHVQNSCLQITEEIKGPYFSESLESISVLVDDMKQAVSKL